MNELYPQLNLWVPPTDEAKPRPEAQGDKSRGRWGDSFRDHWQQAEAGHRFKTHEEMLRFSPLAQGDFSGWHVVVDGDFRSEEVIYQRYRRNCPVEWGDKAPARSTTMVGFYNTMFMWPMLVFGYENFMFMDDVMACGARGIISEPYTDYKAIARRYENCFIAGEGDNRALMRNDPAEIRAMVEAMVETGRMSGGYMMCIGNHIPFNVPAEAAKRYLDVSAELAWR